MCVMLFSYEHLYVFFGLYALLVYFIALQDTLYLSAKDGLGTEVEANSSRAPLSTTARVTI